MFTPSLLFLSLAALVQDAQSTAPTSADWATLNQTLGGRLYTAKPLSSPCFPDFDGVPVSRNETECSVVEDNYLNATFRSSQFGSFMAPQWESCMSSVSQCTLDSSDANNSLAWTDFSCQQGSVAPYYIDVQNATDVQVAFNFSKTTGVPLSIKNTGHDYFGRSSMIGSLALWTRHLDHLSYNASFVPEGGSESYPAMTIGAGAAWVDAYEFANDNNVTIVGGYATSVGASGGWLMGGGHSVLSRTLGLGVDRVLEFKIVTPDGEYRTANAYTNPDLFWALRGGGGGTFGVVLETTSLVEPKQLTLQVAYLEFNSTAETALQFFQVLLDNGLQWAQHGWGGHLTLGGFISVTPLLTLEEAQASMKNATDFVQSQNGTVVIETVSSFYDFFINYAIPDEMAVGNEIMLASRLIPSSVFETQEGRDTFYQAVAALPVDALAAIDIIATPPFLYNYTANSTSANPAWRGSVWHTVLGAEFTWNSTTEEKIAAFESANNLTQLLIDVAPDSGAYMNEANVYEPNYEQSFWGDNYPRLLELKQKYDPTGLLDCWRCVGWKGVNDTRSQCYLSVDADWSS